MICKPCRIAASDNGHYVSSVSTRWCRHRAVATTSSSLLARRVLPPPTVLTRCDMNGACPAVPTRATARVTRTVSGRHAGAHPPPCFALQPAEMVTIGLRSAMSARWIGWCPVSGRCGSATPWRRCAGRRAGSRWAGCERREKLPPTPFTSSIVEVGLTADLLPKHTKERVSRCWGGCQGIS